MSSPGGTNPPRRLRLGDPINATIGKSLGGRRFEVTSRDVPRGWKVELHTRRPEEMEQGAHTTFWVSRVVPVKQTVVVQDGDYGRLPISAAMGKRYAAAIDAFFESVPDGDLLADLRGMAARVDTQDSADWLTVWRLLGEPETGELKELGKALVEIRDLRKAEPARADEIRESVLALWRERLAEAREKL